MRKTPLIALVAASVLLAATAAHADKLVVFKNGKAMKIKNVTEDGQWLRLEFDATNFMAVHRSRIETILEAAAGSADAAPAANQLVPGSRGAANIPGGGRGGGGKGSARPGRLNNQRRGGAVAGRPATADSREAIRKAIEEEQQLLKNPTGRRGPAVNQQQPPGFKQLESSQLNQARTPFEGRRGRGLARKPPKEEPDRKKKDKE